MYKLAIKENLDRKFKKLKKKDRELLVLIDRKVQETLDDQGHKLPVSPLAPNLFFSGKAGLFFITFIRKVIKFNHYRLKVHRLGR